MDHTRTIGKGPQKRQGRIISSVISVEADLDRPVWFELKLVIFVIDQVRGDGKYARMPRGLELNIA